MESNVKDKLLFQLQSWLLRVPMESDENEIRIGDRSLFKLRDGTEREVYKVSFNTPDVIERNDVGEITSFMEGMTCFAYFDAKTLSPLYIVKKSGYIEPDGSY